MYINDDIICYNNYLKMNDLFSNLSIRVFKIMYTETEQFVGMQIQRNRIMNSENISKSLYRKNIK